jgi:hypothetical protein
MSGDKCKFKAVPYLSTTNTTTNYQQRYQERYSNRDISFQYDSKNNANIFRPQ